MAWGIVAVLVIALWVRSYWHIDGLCYTGRVNYVRIGSQIGVVGFKWQPFEPGTKVLNKPGLALMTGAVRPDSGKPRIQWLWRPEVVLINVPFWLCATFFSVLTVAPWLCWQFSLRTLLLATTLFALTLGTIVWLVHR